MSENPKQNLNCGSCSGLNRDRIFEERCVTLGRLPSSKSCGSYVPDVFALVNQEERIGSLQDIADLMNQMGNTDLQILGALMLRERQTRKHGWKFYQRVFIRIRGESNANYLSNFAEGYVLDANKDTVRVIGKNGAIAVSAINDPSSETIYTVARFNKLREKMLAEGHRYDPALLTEEERLKRKAKYGAVVALDQAIEQGIVDKKSVKSKQAKDDLVAFVARLGRGHIKTSRSKDTTQERDKTKVSESVRMSYDTP